MREHYRPAEITCDGLNGWSHQEASCDATNGGLPPGAQIAIIMIALGILCAGTFAWQKYYRKTDAAREYTHQTIRYFTRPPVPISQLFVFTEHAFDDN